MQISGKGIPKSDISILNILNAHTRISELAGMIIPLRGEVKPYSEYDVQGVRLRTVKRRKAR